MKKVENNYKVIYHGPSQIGENSDFIRTHKLEIVNPDTNVSYYIWITPQGEICHTEGINDRTPTEFEFNLYRIAKEYISENGLSSNLGVMEVILLQKEYYELARKEIISLDMEEKIDIQRRMAEIKNLVNAMPKSFEITSENNIVCEENYDVLDDNKQVYVRVSWCNALYARLTRNGINTESDKELFDILSNAINQVWVSPITGRRYAPSLRTITQVLMKVGDVKKIIKVYGTLCSGFFTEGNELVRVDVIFEEDEPKLIIKQFNKASIEGIMSKAPKYEEEQTIISEQLRRQLLKNSSAK